MKLHLFILALMFSVNGLASTMCHRTGTTIAEVQGAGHISPMVGQKVTIEGVVTADFQGVDAMEGFFVQSLQADDDENTSEGLFVHHSRTDVSVGDHVVVHGQVAERFDMTQLNQALIGDVCAKGQALPEPLELTLPLRSQDLESHEGMLLHWPQTLTISDIYHFAQHGQLTLSHGRVFSPTQVVMPGQPAKALKAINALNQLLVDDGRNGQFLSHSVRINDRTQKFSAKHPLRLGYQVTGLTGVLDFGFGRYRLQPTEPINFEAQNSKQQAQAADVGGAFQIATYNIENFFTTIDRGKDICGPKQNWGCRGADSEAEYQRQLKKIVAAIQGSGAEIVALQELENNDKMSLEALVGALNQQGGSWAYVDTGALADDVIKVGIIYQSDAVKAVMSHVVLDDQAMSAFKVHRHRPIVMQAFERPNGDRFQVASIHLKSKSCREAKGSNEAQGDGQGCYAAERTLATKQLMQWLATDPVGLGIKATFLAGDFNSYGREDAMRVLESGGYKDAVRHFHGDENWSASYRGQVGALDHIVANEAALALTTQATQWHINADEFHGFSYDMEPMSKNQAKPPSFYSASPFASSDHDLIILGVK